MTDCDRKLQLALVWHMHQPDYREPGSRTLVLPWVRLHAMKDYYDMPARLRAYPHVKQTFNIVPSLFEQIECYLSGEGSDREWELFRKSADELNDDEKRDMLESFFMAPPETMIKPYPRYAALYEDYRSIAPEELLHRWNVSDWRDLQFWRQLSWIDPLIRREDPFLQGLFEQGSRFSEDRKGELVSRAIYWMGESLEVYRRLQDAGQIEVSVTPYYHPILPLLIDPLSTHEAMPGAPLHPNRECHPEDARAQMEKAIRFYEERFGRRPRGVWPSEGSVSQAVAELFRELEIEWFASDETVLGRSIGSALDPGSGRVQGDRHCLYRPYRTLNGEGPVMVFRDHALSDLIGFDYHQHWDAASAAQDFLSKLHAIRNGWQAEEPPLVTVILDGENCWEYYPNDGEEFLDALYTRLENDPLIECVTISEAIRDRDTPPIERLSAGSWIDGNFHIWIGEESDRRAWELLEETRAFLVRRQREGGIDSTVVEKAWEEIYIAEGSDWFWWFGDTHSTAQIESFDRMFRQHLIHVYELLGTRAPGELLLPIEKIQDSSAQHRLESVMPAPPIIDGKESHYYEWKAAIRFEPAGQSGAMKTAEQSGIERLYYGGNLDRFFLRADSHATRNRKNGLATWEIVVVEPHPVRLRLVPNDGGYRAQRLTGEDAADTAWEPVDETRVQAAGDSVFEAAIDWEVLGAGESSSISFFVSRSTNRQDTEVVPALSTLTLVKPGRPSSTRPWFP